MLRWRNQSAEKTGRQAGRRQNGRGRAVVEPMEGRVLMSASPFADGTSNTIVFAERYASYRATHPGGVNVCFGDGSVKWRRKREVTRNDADRAGGAGAALGQVTLSPPGIVRPHRDGAALRSRARV